MEKITSHKDLMVWQKAVDLVVLIYRITQSFPREEVYALISQMRRCASSIPANIARGRGEGVWESLGNFYIFPWVQLLNLKRS